MLRIDHYVVTGLFGFVLGVMATGAVAQQASVPVEKPYTPEQQQVFIQTLVSNLRSQLGDVTYSLNTAQAQLKVEHQARLDAEAQVEKLKAESAKASSADVVPKSDADKK